MDTKRIFREHEMKERNKRRDLLVVLTLLIVVCGVFSYGSNVEAAKKTGLNKTSVTMYVGETATLKINGTKAKSWSSSNKKVVTVKNGKLTAKKAGKATITCKGKNKNSYKCKVTVKAPCLNATSKKLHVGSTFKLKLTGAKVKSFKANNSNVLVDKNGKVIAKKAGKAVVTVTDTKRKTYKCTIKVEGHSLYTWGKRPATCANEGYSGDQYCSICNKLIKKGTTTAKTAHRLEAEPWSVSEATCERAREEIYRCELCQASVYKTVGKPLGHLYGSTPDYQDEPNCEHEGHNYYNCKREGCYHCKTVVIPALGHDLELLQSSPGTCKSKSINIYHCKRCDNDIQKEGAYGDHCLEDESYAATCIRDGAEVKRCKYCGQKIVDNVIPATGHHSKLVTDSNGNKYITCDDCKIKFTYSTQLGTEDYWRALNQNHELYLQQGSGGRSGFGDIQIGFTDKTWNEFMQEDFNETQRVQADFWKRVKIEIGDENIVVRDRNTEGGSFFYDGKNEQYNTGGLCNGFKKGETTVSVYWDDVLYDSFTVKVGGSIVETVKELMKDNPDMSVTYGWGENNLEVLEMTAETLKEIITAENSDYDKVLAIMNWYKNNVSYYDDEEDLVEAAYWEIFGNHRGQCHHYATAFSLMMEVLDIDCYYVIGEANNGSGTEYHAWNMVYLDANNGKGKQWYYVDPTWNQFDTTKTVKELNGADGVGYYKASSSQAYRQAELYKKLTDSELSNDDGYIEDTDATAFENFVF